MINPHSNSATQEVLLAGAAFPVKLGTRAYTQIKISYVECTSNRHSNIKVGAFI